MQDGDDLNVLGLVVLMTMPLWVEYYLYAGMGCLCLYWLLSIISGVREEVRYAMIRYRIRQARKKHAELYAEK